MADARQEIGFLGAGLLGIVLGTPKLGLRPLPLGDIAHHGAEGRGAVWPEPALAIRAHAADGEEDRDLAALGGDGLDLAAVVEDRGDAAFAERCQVIANDLAAVGIHQLGEHAAVNLGLAVAEDRLGAGAEAQNLPGRVEGDDAIGGSVQNKTKLIGAGAGFVQRRRRQRFGLAAPGGQLVGRRSIGGRRGGLFGGERQQLGLADRAGGRGEARALDPHGDRRAGSIAQRQLHGIGVEHGEGGGKVAARLHRGRVGIAEQGGCEAVGMDHPIAVEQNDARFGEIEGAPHDVRNQAVGGRWAALQAFPGRAPRAGAGGPACSEGALGGKAPGSAPDRRGGSARRDRRRCGPRSRSAGAAGDRGLAGALRPEASMRSSPRRSVTSSQATRNVLVACLSGPKRLAVKRISRRPKPVAAIVVKVAVPAAAVRARRSSISGPGIKWPARARCHRRRGAGLHDYDR